MKFVTQTRRRLRVHGLQILERLQRRTDCEVGIEGSLISISAINGTVQALVRGLDFEFAPIRVNAISPRLVDPLGWDGSREAQSHAGESRARTSGTSHGPRNRYPASDFTDPDQSLHQWEDNSQLMVARASLNVTTVHALILFLSLRYGSFLRLQ